MSAFPIMGISSSGYLYGLLGSYVFFPVQTHYALMHIDGPSQI